MSDRTLDNAMCMDIAPELRARVCKLTACTICTGCYHGHHAECRRTVRCPATGEVNTCRCCGTATAL